MIITQIILKLEPTEHEKLEGQTTVMLERLVNKQWVASDGNGIRGLYPYEIKLANEIQEKIIARDLHSKS
jgi:hypothetical protein